MSKTSSQYKSRANDRFQPKTGGGKYQRGGIKKKDDKKPIK